MLKNKQYCEKNKQFCGAGKSAFLIPDFIFNASCSRHDVAYLEGGGLIDKIMADTFFYAHMLKDISRGEYSFIRRYFYLTMATFYYIMVSIFGGIFFNWKW